MLGSEPTTFQSQHVTDMSHKQNGVWRFFSGSMQASTPQLQKATMWTLRSARPQDQRVLEFVWIGHGGAVPNTFKERAPHAACRPLSFLVYSKFAWFHRFFD